MTEGRRAAERPRIKTIAEESLFDGGALAGGAEGEREESPSGYRIPLCHVVDEPDKYLVHVELPGVPSEAIDLEVGAAEVVVSADATSAPGGHELPPYVGTLQLMEEVDVDSAAVQYRDGLLTLALAKVRSTSRRRVSIESPREDDRVREAESGATSARKKKK